MKQKLIAWFEQLLSGPVASERVHDINVELLLPLSQLYGLGILSGSASLP